MNIADNLLFIFELANNHQGDVHHGLRIIDEMAQITHRHGVQGAIKLQYRDLDTFVHRDFVARQDVAHIPRFLNTRLSPDNFQTLVDAARRQGLRTICTPFDEHSVQSILDHGIDIIKVASCSALDWPLLERIISADKPVIASTGGLSLTQIDKLASFLTHRNESISLLHCVGLYPTPNEELNLAFMARLIHRYPSLTIGYSGHEAPDNLDPVRVAVSLGAKILERHVGVPTATVKLNAYSMNPTQTDAWVATALKTRSILGLASAKMVSQDEQASLRSLQRGTYARHPIGKGTLMTAGDVYFAMPCQADQLTSGQFGTYRAAYTASRDYAAHEPCIESPQVDPMEDTRDIIHDAKGLLSEAQVRIGRDFSIELSHHYGLPRFRHWGVLMVNIINREYCKKVLVMLPGQAHPNHRHMKKEETFQLLWGDLQVNLNGVDHDLEPGDKLVVERGTWHAFSSRTGCVFEEISTTHFLHDSYYEDPAVARLDPIARKTVIDSW